MLVIVFVATAVFLVYTLVRKTTSHPERIEREAHKYSGLNPELYASFVADMNMARSMMGHADIALTFLYRALETLEELSLYTVAGDQNIEDDIYALVQRIGHEFESHIQVKAPRYLNARVS